MSLLLLLGRTPPQASSGSAAVTGGGEIRTWRGAPLDAELPRAFSGKLLIAEAGWAPLETDPDGKTVHAIYFSGGTLYHRRSDDQGRTWNTAVAIGAATDTVLERCLHVSAAGVVHVFYRLGDDLLARRSTDRGATWSTATTLHTNASIPFWRGGFASSGTTVHVAYANDGQVYYRRSTDDGASWGTQSQPYTTGGGYEYYSRPSLACAGSVLVLTLAASATGSARLVEEKIVTGRSADGGDTWDPFVVHTEATAFYAHRPDVHAVSASVILLTWQEGSNKGGTTQPNGWLDIVMRRSTDAGATWGAPTKLFQGNGAGTLWRHEHAWVASRGDNVGIVVSAGDNVDNNLRCTVRLSEDAGLTWTARQITMNSSPTAAPTLCFTRDLVHVSANDYVGNAWYQGARMVVTRPSARLIDDFDRASIGTSWTAGGYATANGPPVIVSNAATRAAGGGYRQEGYWNERTLPYDVILIGEFGALSAADFDEVGLVARLVDPGGTGSTDAVLVGIERQPSGQHRIRIGHSLNGADSTTAVGTDITPAFEAGMKYALVAEGVLLRFWVKAPAGEWVLFHEQMNETLARTAGYVSLDFTGDQTTRLNALYAEGIVDEARTGTASVIGTGSVVATGTASAGISGAATIVGSGATEAVGAKGGLGTSAVAGGGSALAAGAKGALGVAELSGGGAVLASGALGATGTAATSAGGSVLAAGAKGGRSAATSSADGAVIALGILGGLGAAAMAAGGATVASGLKGALGLAATTAGGSVVATGAGAQQASGAAVVTTDGSVLAAGAKSALGSSVTEASGTVVVAGNAAVAGSGAAIVTGSGSVGATGIKGGLTASATTADSTTTTTGAKGASGGAVLGASSTSEAAGAKGGLGIAAISTSGTIALVSGGVRGSTSTLEGGGSVVVLGSAARGSVVVLEGGGLQTSTGRKATSGLAATIGSGAVVTSSVAGLPGSPAITTRTRTGPGTSRTYSAPKASRTSARPTSRTRSKLGS